MKNKYIIRLVTLLTTMVYAAQSTSAADIHRLEPNSSGKVWMAVIEGEITNGDCDAFVKVIRDNGAKIKIVGILSRGGDFDEAMKIGKVIRSMKLATVGPTQYGDKPANPPLGCPPSKDIQDMVCADAGFFIYIAGIERHRSILKVNQPHLLKDSFGRLSEMEAKKAYDSLSARANDYLIEMDTPKRIQECVMSARPDSPITLSEEITVGFFGTLPYREEWLNAKYPSLSKEDATILTSLKERVYSLGIAGNPHAAESYDFKAIIELKNRGIAALSEQDRATYLKLSTLENDLYKARSDGEDNDRTDAYKKYFGFEPSDIIDYDFAKWITASAYLGKHFQDILNQEKFGEDDTIPSFRILKRNNTAITPMVLLYGDQQHPREVMSLSVVSHPNPSKAFTDAIIDQYKKEYGDGYANDEKQERVWVHDGLFVRFKINQMSGSGPYLSADIRKVDNSSDR